MKKNNIGKNSKGTARSLGWGCLFVLCIIPAITFFLGLINYTVDLTFLFWTLILFILTGLISIIYNVALILLGIVIALITQNFVNLLVVITMSVERFFRDAFWAQNFFKNNFNEESFSWILVFFLVYLINLFISLGLLKFGYSKINDDK